MKINATETINKLKNLKKGEKIIYYTGLISMDATVDKDIAEIRDFVNGVIYDPTENRPVIVGSRNFTPAQKKIGYDRDKKVNIFEYSAIGR